MSIGFGVRSGFEFWLLHLFSRWLWVRLNFLGLCFLICKIGMIISISFNCCDEYVGNYIKWLGGCRDPSDKPIERDFLFICKQVPHVFFLPVLMIILHLHLYFNLHFSDILVRGFSESLERQGWLKGQLECWACSRAGWGEGPEPSSLQGKGEVDLLAVAPRSELQPWREISKKRISSHTQKGF